MHNGVVIKYLLQPFYVFVRSFGCHFWQVKAS